MIRGKKYMKKKIIGIFGIGLLLISTIMVVGINLPDQPVTLNAVDGTTSYFMVTLSNVPADNDVTNGVYPGWCADRDVTMVRGVNHQVTLYDSYDPSLPAAFQSPNWDKINWILNYKDAYSMQTIQDAFWYLLGDYAWSQISTITRELVNQSQNDFTPEPGQILAIVAVPETNESDCQCSFIEVTIPSDGDEGLTPGYWKNHLGSWYTYDPNATVASVFTLPSALSTLGSDTLLEALHYNGGNKDIGAARILLRAAVAALLNAAHPEIDYPMTEAAIIQEVNTALTQGRTAMLDCKDILDGFNNLGADL